MPHRISNSDTFRRVFERLDPKALAECLYDWLGMHWEENTAAAIDGKSIREKRAEYVISLKGNQPALLEDVSLYFKDFGTKLPSFTTKEKDHGRIEKRE